MADFPCAGGDPFSSFQFPDFDFNWNANSSSPTILWTRYQDKIFEHAIVLVPENSPDRWLRIAGFIPGKSAAEVRERYDELVSDVLRIESGRVGFPSYSDDSAVSSPEYLESEKTLKSGGIEAERKKGKPWTRKEHQLFLMGLKKFGKGDWRSISRNLVITRTPTQVASHAQKYFIRQESTKRDRKRSSIHDITTVDGNSTAANTTNQGQYGQFISTIPMNQPPLPPQQFASAGYFPDQTSLLEYY